MSRDLFVRDAGVAGGLAVLREDELAFAGEARADEGKLALVRRERARPRVEEREAGLRVGEDVGDEGEDGPPVAGRAGSGAGLGHGVAAGEEAVVDGSDVGRGVGS